MLSGLVFGLLFAFLLKRSRFCPTGTMRDLYLEKRWSNLWLLLGVIVTEGLIYHSLVALKMIPKPELGPFSLLGVALGSFMFGFGAVLCNGCMTASLLKAGDGRVIGWLSIVVFMLSGYLANVGKMRYYTVKLSLIAEQEDNLYHKLPFSPIWIFAIALPIVAYFLYKDEKKRRPRFKMPQRLHGIRYFLGEKLWPQQLVVILIGALMALAFIFSNRCGRNGSFAISSPLLIWFGLATGLKVEPGG